MTNTLNLDQKLQQIELSCRHKANHLLSGHYQSVFKGQGIEFDEVRQYTPGDDVRHIDWNITARTGDVYIKRFHEEREINVIFVVDQSASFAWSSQQPSRLEAAAKICALIGNAALSNNDRIGLLQYSSDVDNYQPPMRGRSQLMRCLMSILSPDPSVQTRQTNFHLALDRLNQLPLKRSIVVIVSDFFNLSEQSEDWEMLSILAQQHEVLACTLDDPAELEATDSGLIWLQDSESDAVQLIDSSDSTVQQSYRNQMQHRLKARTELFTRAGIDLLSHRLDQDPVATLLAYFHARRMRAQSETGG